jgi:hypothetical protein
MIAFIEQNARSGNPRARLTVESDDFVELVYHKTRAVIAHVPVAEREASLAWLRAHGSKPISLPVSPTAARSIGLVPEAGRTVDWVDGPPAFPPSGWRDMRAYLPAPLPEDWVIVQHRGDGALEIHLGDGTVLVLSGARIAGKQKIVQASVGHERDAPVDAAVVLKRLRGVARFVERGTYDGLQLFTGPVRARSGRGDIEH